MQRMIGVDIGTTSTKAVLYDLKGTVQADAHVAYPLIQTVPDMAEQDPDVILQAVVSVLHQVMQTGAVQPGELQGVSFSAAMHSLILMDGHHQPLTQVLTWADNRAVQASAALKASDVGQAIYQRTGTPLHPMAPLAKIIWLRETAPALFKQTSYFIDIKTYVFQRLFHTYQMDYSMASATGLFNLARLDWDEQALAVAGITRAQLPKLVETTAQITGLDARYSALTGIEPTVPFIFGASDGVLSNLGVNAIEPGVVAVTIGTSGAVRVVVDHPIVDPKGRLFCYALTKHRWVVGGPVNNGGIVLRWVQEQLFAADESIAYDAVTKLAATVPAGAAGLLCHPYLGGERAPLWDADARGSFFGLTRQHTRAHMVRAALEGTIFNLAQVLQLIEQVTSKPKRIQATGGFVRSALWCQMMADIFEQPVTIPTSFESSCLGAAVLGMRSLGLIADLTAIRDMVGTTKTYQPNPENTAVYQQLQPIWNRLAKIYQSEYNAIAAFQRQSTTGAQ